MFTAGLEDRELSEEKFAPLRYLDATPPAKVSEGVLEKNHFANALRESRFFGADPVLGLPMLFAVIGRPVHVEVRAAAVDPRLQTGFLAQITSFLKGFFVGFEGTVYVVPIVDNMPVHMGSRGNAPPA